MDLPPSTRLRPEWHREDDRVACRAGGRPRWAFAHGADFGKPHFCSFTPRGEELLEVGPADHRWHYGLWFSWKFLNGLNYWEENGPGNRAEGATCWAPPAVDLRPDGGATLRFELTYRNFAGAVELIERREIAVSPPEPDGGFAIDWRARFEAVAGRVVLERTPMPGEPGGQVNGGYGGLGLRLPVAPHGLDVVTPDGPVGTYTHERARPFVPAIGCNVTLAGRALGGVALVNLDPACGAPAPLPWYVANMPGMRFVCAALLAPAPLTLARGETLDLRYRALVRPAAWTPESLCAVLT